MKGLENECGSVSLEMRRIPACRTAYWSVMLPWLLACCVAAVHTPVSPHICLQFCSINVFAFRIGIHVCFLRTQCFCYLLLFPVPPTLCCCFSLTSVGFGVAEVKGWGVGWWWGLMVEGLHVFVLVSSNPDWGQKWPSILFLSVPS